MANSGLTMGRLSAALETLPKLLSEGIAWHWTSEQEIVATNDTSDVEIVQLETPRLGS